MVVMTIEMIVTPLAEENAIRAQLTCANHLSVSMHSPGSNPSSEPADPATTKRNAFRPGGSAPASTLGSLAANLPTQGTMKSHQTVNDHYHSCLFEHTLPGMSKSRRIDDTYYNVLICSLVNVGVTTMPGAIITNQ